MRIVLFQTIGSVILNEYIHQSSAAFVAAPVSFINTHSFISLFQCLDFISLQGITAAAVSAGFHSMCNGANLAYSKTIFYAVGGFKGIDNIASGDDMLLMDKIQKKVPGSVGFLFSKTSVVQTLPMATWKDFINQRIRWASKTSKYKDKKIVAVLDISVLVQCILTLIRYSFFLSNKIACILADINTNKNSLRIKLYGAGCPVFQHSKPY